MVTLERQKRANMRYKKSHPERYNRIMVKSSKKWQRENPEKFRLIQVRHTAVRRGLGCRLHRKNKIDEEVHYHHITDQSIIAIPSDLHNLYNRMEKEAHRFMCRQIINQIYN